MSKKNSTGQDQSGKVPETGGTDAKAEQKKSASKNGSWQKIEALREKAALKESLADVWDEDFDLDEETLADLDHTAEFFTSQEAVEEELPVEDEEVDEFFEDDEV